MVFALSLSAIRHGTHTLPLYFLYCYNFIIVAFLILALAHAGYLLVSIPPSLYSFDSSKSVHTSVRLIGASRAHQFIILRKSGLVLV